MDPSLVGTILHAHYGYDCTLNSFCIIVSETPKTVVLARLKKEVTSWNGVDGTERPIIPKADELEATAKDDIFRVVKKEWNGQPGESNHGLYHAAGGCFYKVWDGTDQYYNQR